MRITTSLPRIAAVAVALALTVAGCSNGTPTAANSTTSATQQMFSDADVTFVQQMFPHHAQAVDMAALVDGRTATPAVLQLAAKIKSEQKPEMDTMTSMLVSWGKPAPSAAMNGMAGMDHSAMPGMMSAADMSTLSGLSGTAFDQKWLSMMTAHHQGAITMATTELSTGSNPDAKKLATNITSAQQAEIAQMRTLIHA